MSPGLSVWTIHAMTHPRSLLIIRLTALGDVVQTLQVAQSVAAQWPECRITWVVRDTFAPLVEAASFVHEVIAYRRKDGLRGLLAAYRAIRRKHFDLVWDMQSLVRPASMALFARASEKWGRKTKKGLRSLPYKRSIPQPQGQHAMVVHQQFLREAKLDPAISIPLSLKPAAPMGQLADEWAPFSACAADRLFILFTDSSHPGKMWNDYAALSRLIWDNIPESRIVWGGLKPLPPPPDAPPGRFLDLQGRCSLPQMITVVRQPSVFIGNDSGPMHLSAALGNRVLALFGPTTPQRFGPWPLGASNTASVCSPTTNLVDLSVTAVFDALQTLLRQPVPVASVPAPSA